MMYLYVWRSGTFLLYSCKLAFWIQETLPRLSDVERSVVLRSVFAISSTLAYLLFFRECATPPYVQVYHTTWLSFTSPSPALVLQATNAGVRRPGYKASPCWGNPIQSAEFLTIPLHANSTFIHRLFKADQVVEPGTLVEQQSYILHTIKVPIEKGP